MGRKLSSYFAGSGMSGSGMTLGPPAPPPGPSFRVHASTGTDNGAIALLQRTYGASRLPHGSVEELGRALVRADEESPVTDVRTAVGGSSVILGHGSPGYLEVGAGQYGYSRSKSISLSNVDLWSPIFSAIARGSIIEDRFGAPFMSHFRTITLVSCATAAGEGRKLLQRIADLSNAVVFGYTGLVFTDGNTVFAERGGGPYCCSPSGQWVGIEAANPCRHWHEPKHPTTSVSEKTSLQATQGMQLLAPSVRTISVVVKNLLAGTEKEFPPSVAADLIRFALATPPYENDGTLVGAATWRCTVNYDDGKSLVIDVIADRVAQVKGVSCFVSQELWALFGRLGLV